MAMGLILVIAVIALGAIVGLVLGGILLNRRD